MLSKFFVYLVVFAVAGVCNTSWTESSSGRSSTTINQKWRTILADKESFSSVDLDCSKWKTVSIPHNHEDYHGYRGIVHGNLHGTAWYRKEISINKSAKGKQIFIRFEGVGSIATVYLNGSLVKTHKGGLTGFSCDITPFVKFGEKNVLAVKAEHPAKSKTQAWSCGGCFGTPNTEGSQPFGIHRSVHLEIMGEVRVEPFGTHVWCPEVSHEKAKVKIQTELKNYGEKVRKITITQRIFNSNGTIELLKSVEDVPAGTIKFVDQTSNIINNPHLWSPDDPFLHYVETVITDHKTGVLLDNYKTSFGIRWFDWPKRQQKEQKIYTHVRKSIDHLKKINLHVDSVEVTTPKVSKETAQIQFETTITNTGKKERQAILAGEFLSNDGTVFFEFYRDDLKIKAGETVKIVNKTKTLNMPTLWTKEKPYLYKIRTSVLYGNHNKKQYLLQDTPFKLSTELSGTNKSAIVNIKTPEKKSSKLSTNDDEIGYFRVNGKQVFLNGTCEYMHMLGRDHAFSKKQIETKVDMVKQAGFNAFRDAHHPHDLYYYDLLDKAGILCYTQITSHQYFPNKEFRDNYRQVVREWVKERRNHPSIMIWGLQNESKLPESFAKELTRIVRSLDPTSPKDRPTTTCNGGKGSDWNVPQEWWGTYGGNCNDYNPAKRFGKGTMVGEYGAWRHYGKHYEKDYKGSENDWSETYHVYNLETKVRLGEKYRDTFCGQFQWIFASHANPGRPVRRLREGDGVYDIAPVNGKGLLTSWYEPLDSYYMYRSNYIDKKTDPMVYIAGHNWPSRWKSPGIKNGIKVFSNCDEVELFNDLGKQSLGTKKREGIGTHFRWDNVDVKYNVLYAVGKVDGKIVAKDIIVLNNLPQAPAFAAQQKLDTNNTKTTKNDNVIYRVNCGGGDYIDVNGNSWSADQVYKDGSWGSISWADKFEGKPKFFGSVNQSYGPVTGTLDDKLIQSYRFGLDQLKYCFPVKDGNYKVELYFVEPWYGRGGIKAKGWRKFDVSINGNIAIKDLDIWSEVGNDAVLKKVVDVEVKGGILEIGFTKHASSQGIISGIAIIVEK